MTSDVNQSVYSDVGRLVAAPTPSLDFFRIATEAGLFAARNRNLLSGDQSSGTARPADTNSPFGQFNAQGNPTDIVDRDNRYHTQLGWQPVDSNNPNSPQEVASISDWRYQGSWTRQRDASGRLSDMWHGPNGQQWRGAISVLPDGTIRETHHSANGTTLDTRTYNPNTGTVIRQDAAGQVSVVAFPGNQVWTFERNAQGAVTARLNDQVMPGNYQFSPQGFTRTNPDGTVEQWNYDGTRTTRRRDGQGNQVI